MYKHKTTLIKCFWSFCSVKIPITQNPDNSKKFQFPLAIRVIGVQLYILKHKVKSMENNQRTPNTNNYVWEHFKNI